MHTLTIRSAQDPPGFDVTCVCVRDGETILDAVLRAGWSYRYACRRGGCVECKTQLLSGEVVYNKRIAKMILPDEERECGVCLTCRAVPLTDVEMELQEGDALQCVSPLMAEIARAELDRQQAARSDSGTAGVSQPGQRQRA